MDSKVLSEMGIDPNDPDQLDSFISDIERIERLHNFVREAGRANGLNSDQIKECVVYVKAFEEIQAVEPDIATISDLNNRFSQTDTWSEFPNIRAELTLQSQPHLQAMQPSFKTEGLLPAAYKTVQATLDFANDPKNKLLDVKRF